MHQYTWTKLKPKFFFGSLSCFECSIGVRCKHFSMGDQDFIDFSAKKSQPVEKKFTLKNILGFALPTNNESSPRTTRSKNKKPESVKLILNIKCLHFGVHFLICDLNKNNY